jgi:starch synthase
LKVLFVASEGAPFVKTGGLGDVVGSLPKALKKMGIDVRVILPKYRDIPWEYGSKMEPLAHAEVPLAWRKQGTTIYTLEHGNIPFYFIENYYYFGRSGIYGFYDEAERFGFFSKAVIDSMVRLDYYPDIIHCHDWHTAPISVYLKALYKDNPKLKRIKTLFTIHNLKFQGIFPPVVLEDVLGLDKDLFVTDGIEYNGQVNYMKGALLFSHWINTVSPTYNEEIKTEFFGEGLDGLLKSLSYKTSGILNGIDYEEFNPSLDKFIPYNYDFSSLEKKEENKKALQRELNLPQKDVPMVSLITRLTSQKGIDLVMGVIEDIMALDLQLVVLGTGDKKYHDIFNSLKDKYPHNISVNITFDNNLAHRIYAGSDLLLMPSLFEPCGLSQLIAMRYGTIPLVRETGGLKDTVTPYNEVTKEGNGFTFTNYNAHDMLYTLNRALHIYKDRDKWEKVVFNAMNSDYSWNASAKLYMELYNKLLELGV